MLSPEEVREHIPLTKKVIYADNCATTPVPKPVLDAMLEYWIEYPMNVERGAYSLASYACEVWDKARAKAAKLLLNCEPDEFIFTRNFTEGACLVAYGLEHPLINRKNGKLGQEEPIVKWERGSNVVFSSLDHHSNILPWMRLAYRVGAEVRVIEFDVKSGLITVDSVLKVVDERTKVLALQHVSNVTGMVHPVEDIIKEVKERYPDIFIFVDGSQGPGHMKVDVKRMGCDAYAFSGHKGPLGPQGSGGVYVKREHLAKMDPMEIGGGTIADVTVRDYELRGDVLSKRWEAGTPSIACLIGLGRAAEYVANEIGLENIEKREKKLVEQLIEGLREIPNVELYGELEDMSRKAGILSFNVKGWKCHDVSLALDAHKPPILTRAGHHCAIPACRRLGVWEKYGGTVRASFHYYNVEWEVEEIVKAIREIAS